MLIDGSCPLKCLKNSVNYVEDKITTMGFLIWA